MTGPKAMRWTGIVLTVLSALFLLLDAVMHLIQPPPVVEAFNQLGVPPHLAPVLGIVELLCIVVYVVPRTSVLGAILLAGYLGGATAAKVRIEDSSWWFSVLIGVLVWAGVYLRNDRLRALIPLVRS